MIELAHNQTGIAQYLGLQRLSETIGLCERTIRAKVKDSRDPLPAYRVGGKLLFKWSEVEQWIKRHRVVPLDIELLMRDLLEPTDTSREDKNSNAKGSLQ